MGMARNSVEGAEVAVAEGRVTATSTMVDPGGEMVGTREGILHCRGTALCLR